MADWGVAKGLSALYGDTGKRQNAKNELAIMGMLDNKRRADEKEEQAARIEQQAYEEKVSAFSATLLAPDRKRLNDKSKMLAKKVRENVQMFGGDMSKFMANGGGQVMQNYKTSLLNSDEAIVAADNKKNMDLIVKAQWAGKTLNPTDLRNLAAYNKNGEGPITYTGLMNEIDMPNAKAYAMGQPIPNEDILGNKDNYMKILGNFVTTFPDMGQPTETQLLAFVEMNYKGVGENYQAAAASAKYNKAAKEQREHEKLYARKQTGDIVNLKTKFGKNVTLDNFKEGEYYNTKARKDMISTMSSEMYDSYHNDYALKEKSIFDVNAGGVRALNALLSEEYGPRNAPKIMQGQEMEFAGAALGLTSDEQKKTMNFSSMEIRDWMPNDDSYTASGFKVGDKRGGDSLDKESYKGTWKVKAVIMGAYGTVANGDLKGSSQMVMNTFEGGQYDREKSDKWDDEIMKGSHIEQDPFIVMENEDGDVFYQKIDASKAPIMSQLSENLDTLDHYDDAVQTQEWNRKLREGATKAANKQAKPIKEFYNNVLNNKDTQESIRAEILNYSPDGNMNLQREKLMQSFYGAMADLAGGNSEETYAVETAAFKFTSMLKEASEAAGMDYGAMLKDGSLNDIDFLGLMAKDDPDSVAFYQSWMANYQVISQR